MPLNSADPVKLLSKAMSVEPPIAATAHPLRGAPLRFSRFTAHSNVTQIVQIPTERLFLLVLALADGQDNEIYSDGQHRRTKALRSGEFNFRDYAVKTTIKMRMNFDNLHFYLPADTFTAFAEEHGTRFSPEINIRYMDSIDDAVVRNLGHCLLPALDHPEQVSTLFLDHVMVALVAHLTGTHGCNVAKKPVHGGLTPRQVQRVTDLLTSRLNAQVRLEELARECDLSRSHFARAFKKTLGIPPHRWLVQRRLERARELLLTSRLSLAEIADVCGFADQSHFTRCFSRALGVVPSEWRRMRTG